MKVQIPILNKAAGRLRNTIFQSYWGATYLRSMPLLFHYPDTPDQQRTQAIFFDIQRNWIPIYQQLMQYAAPSQRKNMNTFNRLSRYVYKILDPYNAINNYITPKVWGLERLNKMRPAIPGFQITFKDESIFLDFDVNRPYNDTNHYIRWYHVLLCNLTQKNMLYQVIPVSGETEHVVFSNTLEWLPSNRFRFYIALSDDHWLGNFNICDPR